MGQPASDPGLLPLSLSMWVEQEAARTVWRYPPRKTSRNLPRRVDTRRNGVCFGPGNIEGRDGAIAGAQEAAGSIKVQIRVVISCNLPRRINAYGYGVSRANNVEAGDAAIAVA